jgi:hypothetical protein
MSNNMTEEAIFEQLKTLQQGQLRLETMLDREIKQLKTEQIADLRRDKDRLADDQRRLWEAVSLLQQNQHISAGGRQMVQTLMTACVGLVSGGMGAVAAHFLH